jgi:hypothetical protein
MAAAVQQQQVLTVPVLTSKEEMRAFSRKQKMAGKIVGFVPTMVRGVLPQSWLPQSRKGEVATDGYCQLQDGLTHSMLSAGLSASRSPVTG